MIDKHPTPLGVFDTDLSDKFVHAFETMGGTWQSNSIVKSAHWNNKNVVVELDDGSIIEGEKLLYAAGCLANVDIFVESIFNFPTLAEAYRVAALSLNGQRHQKRANYYCTGSIDYISC
jgi:hypothetical protein